MRLIVAADATEAAQLATGELIRACVEAIALRGRAIIAVSGGATPVPMLTLFARSSLPWDRVYVAQVDERAVPRDDPRRNLAAASRALCEQGRLPSDHLLPMPVEDSGERATARYAAQLSELVGSPPVLDVMHLGLGEDGHTASLVPDDPVLQVTDRDVAWTSAPYQGTRRMTLTYPALNRARERLWLVNGAEKAVALSALLADTGQAPAAGIDRANALVIADRAARPDVRARR